MNAEILWRLENEEGWILEKVAFDAAYDEERVYAFIFLPTTAKAPYQTVIYAPEGGVVWQETSENFEDYFEYHTFLEFSVRSGRL